MNFWNHWMNNKRRQRPMMRWYTKAVPRLLVHFTSIARIAGWFASILAADQSQSVKKKGGKNNEHYEFWLLRRKKKKHGKNNVHQNSYRKWWANIHKMCVHAKNVTNFYKVKVTYSWDHYRFDENYVHLFCVGFGSQKKKFFPTLYLWASTAAARK